MASRAAGRRGVEWPSLAGLRCRRRTRRSARPVAPETDHYLVYLSGIGISGPEQLPVFEDPMVERLAERVGRTTVIWDIYPYSPANTALTQGRRLSGLWRRRLPGILNSGWVRWPS